MSRGGEGRSATRVVGYRVVVPRADVDRVERLLIAATSAGHVTQWDGSGGFFWFNGAPGASLRTLRKAVGGTPVLDEERVDDVVERVLGPSAAPPSAASRERKRLPRCRRPGAVDPRPATAVVCRICHVDCPDTEPMAPSPDYEHPAGDCRFASQRMLPEMYVPWRRKRDRRARSRGAKQASKYRA